MNQPLEGIRIIEFGHYIAAPAATQTLTDLGADVIKIEPPAGDQARNIGAYGEGIVRAFNRGKRSVVIDLKDQTGHGQALKLIESADVVVQNLRAGAMAKLGLGPDELRARLPGLVYVSVSGFNSKSPSATRAGLDIAAQAESGLMSITGEDDGDPQRVGFPIVDAAASYAVVQAVLTALLRKARTGEGATAEVSLLDVAIHMQSAVWGEWHTSGREPTRKGNGQATVAPAADIIHTVDGSIVLSAYTTEHFETLCRIIDKAWMLSDQRYLDNPSRVAHRADLLAEITNSLGHLSTEDCIAFLSSNGLVAAAVRTFSDVAGAPDVLASEILTTGVGPDGDVFTIPALPFDLHGVQVQAGRDVPQLGAHSEELLS